MQIEKWDLCLSTLRRNNEIKFSFKNLFIQVTHRFCYARYLMLYLTVWIDFHPITFFEYIGNDAPFLGPTNHQGGTDSNKTCL